MEMDKDLLQNVLIKRHYRKEGIELQLPSALRIMSALLLNIINSKNTISFCVAVNNFESLKKEATSERLGKEINRFARIPDGSEIFDFDTLGLIYKNHVNRTKKNEMKLVALSKDEHFSPDDIKYFGCAESYKLVNLIKELKDAESVDLCFLMPCTKSIEKYVDELDRILVNIYKGINSTFKNYKVRCSFVCYTTYNNNSRKITYWDFTENFKELKKNFDSIEYDIRNSYCEDVIGGLDTVCKLNWIHKSRVLLHICDAPCYGKEYHDENDDDFPNGDPTGIKLSELMKKLVELNVDYYFLEISDKTKRMVDVFIRELNLIPGHKNLTVYKLSHSNELLNTIATSITLTISTLQKSTYSCPINKELKLIEVRGCYWENLSNFKSNRVDHYKFKFDGKIEDIQNLITQFESREETSSTPKLNSIDKFFKYEKDEDQNILLNEVPFAKGYLRYAYPAILINGEKSERCVLKNSLYIGYNNWFSTNQMAIKSQIVAKFLAEEFCKMLEEKWNYEKTIKFLDIGLIGMKDVNEYYSIESFINGDFIKWNSNIGVVNENDYTCTLDAFAHWTYQITNGYLIVNDLQGCIVDNQFLLTDPSISCVERQFDSTDLSELGILRFFEFHRCNQICRKLKLKKHDFQKQPDRPDNAKLTKINDKIQIH